MRERRGGHPAWTTRLVAGAAGAVLAMVASPGYAQDDEESGGSTELCAIHDGRVAAASGIVAAADGDGWWLLPDGTGQVDDVMTIRKVGADCNVRDTETGSIYVDHKPIDPEDLAIDGQGYLWAADIGTDIADRDTISLTRVSSTDGGDYSMTRYVYPDGIKDAQAYLLLPDGTPLFIPSVEGQVPLYAPVGAMLENDTPMELAGTGTFTEGGTATGAALNADASKVVVRTATTAYEWDVAEGGVVAAIAEGEPRLTPLSEDIGGQGIAYDADGNFLTVSLTGESEAPASIRQYTPTAPAAEEPATDEGGGDGDAEEDGGGFVDFVLGLGFDTIVKILATIAVVGMGVMIGGIMVIRKSRREREAAGDDGTEEGFAAEESVFGDLASDPGPADPVEIGLDTGHPDPEVGMLAQGNVYGAAPAEPSGNVYGAKRAESSGSVYGAKPAEPPGNVYGAPKAEAPGAVYGGAREEPQYGAFEAAGHGSIYNDAGESFAVAPPPAAAPPAPPAPPPPAAPPHAAPAPAQQGGTYGAPRESTGSVYGGGGDAPPGTYGSPREPSGGVYGGGAEGAGRVYGAEDGAGNNERTPESDDFWGPPEGGSYGSAGGRGR